jgi:pimeloyl-ACP methyl ester carboxylesterase
MKTGWMLVALWLLAGCTGLAPSQPIYEAHLARFRAENPHVDHRIRRAGGHHIQAREFNPSAKGKLPTLVLMHGFPDNQHLYDRLIPRLTAGFHVVTFDFLGWGNSDKPVGHVYDVASQIADLEAVVAHLDLRKLVLVLHDLSGQSGIDWALEHPDRIEALVLLNTYYSPMASLVAPEAIQFHATPGLLRDLAVWGATQSGINFQNGVGGQLSRFFSDPTVREAYTPIITHASVSIRPAFFSSTSVLWKELESRRAMVPRLRMFSKPVHIIFGEDDPYLNPGVAKAFAAIFPRATLALIPKAGHYVQLDRADALAPLLQQKLAAP